jgi:hypothetical protein
MSVSKDKIVEVGVLGSEESEENEIAEEAMVRGRSAMGIDWQVKSLKWPSWGDFSRTLVGRLESPHESESSYRLSKQR